MYGVNVDPVLDRVIVRVERESQREERARSQAVRFAASYPPYRGAGMASQSATRDTHTHDRTTLQNNFPRFFVSQNLKHPSTTRHAYFRDLTLSCASDYFTKYVLGVKLIEQQVVP